MIKTDNGVFYLTAGETCYILKTANDGKLETVYFGKRFEREDDLTALGYGAENSADKLIGEIYRGEKKLAAEFIVDNAEVLSIKPETGAPALFGGKTLKICLSCTSEKLRAEVYITPYPRGGFSRRTVLINDGKEVTFKAQTLGGALAEDVDIISVTKGGDVVRSACAQKQSSCSGNFVIAATKNSSETHGDVYGYLCVFGDGTLYAEKRNGNGTNVVCCDGDKLKLCAGERYLSPEVLSVFSYNGTGGMSRVFHDIIREGMGDKYTGKRRPIVLFCPDMSEKKMCEAASVAAELGLDVFTADGGKASRSGLRKIYDMCKSAGIKLGIKITPNKIEKNSAAYVSDCTEIKPNVYAVDFSDGQLSEKYIVELENLIKECGIEYLMIDVPQDGLKPFALGMYRLRAELATKFPELFIEWNNVPHEMRYGMSMCYPPCIMRNLVEYESNSFKAKFDSATFGCLGYALNPLELSDDAKRAVRAQIFSYQDDAPIVMLGDLYRLESTSGGKCLMSVTKDKSKAYVVCLPSSAQSRVRLKGLDEHNLYHVRELDKTFSGAVLGACGVAVPPAKDGWGTFVLHIRQVTDYDIN